MEHNPVRKHFTVTVENFVVERAAERAHRGLVSSAAPIELAACTTCFSEANVLPFPLGLGSE